VLRELAVVDRELDAIDDELAAATLPGPATRDDAIAATTVRIAALQRTAPDALFEDTPTLLVRGANAYYAARERDAELANEHGYGARHPERILQRRAIEALRGAFDRQRDVELAVTAAAAKLGKLPKQATAVKVRQSNRRALQRRSRGSRAMASCRVTSAELRVAATRRRAKQRVDAGSHSLGEAPGHDRDAPTSPRRARDAIALDATLTRGSPRSMHRVRRSSISARAARKLARRRPARVGRAALRLTGCRTGVASRDCEAIVLRPRANLDTIGDETVHRRVAGRAGMPAHAAKRPPAKPDPRRRGGLGGSRICRRAQASRARSQAIVNPAAPTIAIAARRSSRRPARRLRRHDRARGWSDQAIGSATSVQFRATRASSMARASSSRRDHRCALAHRGVRGAVDAC
jgi:hypothetical protein